MNKKILNLFWKAGLFFGLIMLIGAGCKSAPAVDNVKKINFAGDSSNKLIVEKADDSQVANGSNIIEKEPMEFVIESFASSENGQFLPQFSVKEMTVRKGDKVKLKVTVTSGTHDFNIDEFNIHEATSLNKEKVIEFIADQAGEFVYYCNMPGHRAAGQWGTLKVLE